MAVIKFDFVHTIFHEFGALARTQKFPRSLALENMRFTIHCFQSSYSDAMFSSVTKSVVFCCVMGGVDFNTLTRDQYKEQSVQENTRG